MTWRQEEHENVYPPLLKLIAVAFIIRLICYERRGHVPVTHPNFPSCIAREVRSYINASAYSNWMTFKSIYQCVNSCLPAKHQSIPTPLPPVSSSNTPVQIYPSKSRLVGAGRKASRLLPLLPLPPPPLRLREARHSCQLILISSFGPRVLVGSSVSRCRILRVISWV